MVGALGISRVHTRILAVVVLAVLAGCGSLGASNGGGEPTPTMTPAPVPDAGPTAVDGVLSDRLVADTIVENHRETLSNTSYTAIETLRMGAPDNATYERRTVMRVAPGGAPFRVDEEIVGPVARASGLSTDVWWDGEVAYYRRPYGGSGVTHSDRTDEPDPPLQIHDRFEDVLAATDVSSIERGTGNATIVAGSVDDASVLPRRGDFSVLDNATTAMQIESDGVVSRLVVGYDATDYYDGNQRVRYVYQVTEIGSTTVEPPAWVDTLAESE